MGRKQFESTEALWRDCLARFIKSSLTVKQFCRHEGVSDASFYQWRKRLKVGPQMAGPQVAEPAGRSAGGPNKTAKSPPFVPVRMSSAEGMSVAGVMSAIAEVEFPNGVRIRVPAMHAEALRIAILTGNEVCREVG